jgi:serine phosphatase RsbU (regulator of sigma subunit)/pSer/pThr/pTyr-binding forkhead associated (FHA) protein
MIILEVQPLAGETFEVPVKTDSLVIGRSAQADVSIADRSLSRRHARLFRDGDQWLLEDLASRHGTYINGRKVSQSTPVRAGDIIGLSGSLVTVRDSDAPSPPRQVEDISAQSVFRSAETIIGETLHMTAGEPSADPSADRAKLVRWADRLRIVNEVHEALGRSMAVDELLELILDRVFLHLRPRHGAVFLKEGDDLVCARHRSDVSGQEDFPESRRLVDEVVGKGLAAVVTDARTDEVFGTESMLSAGVRTLLAAPLMTPEGALGMIVLCSDSLDHQFSETDLELLVLLASAAALRIRIVKLTEEAVERQRFEQDVALARRIQVALLPAAMPQTPGVEIYGGNIPSRGVSGDYYQVMEGTSDDEVVIIVADVSGKGIGASLLTGYVDALFLAYLSEDHDPAEIFSRVSPQMNSKTPVESFATAFLGIFNVSTGRLRYASAGHDPPVLARATGDVEGLDPTGMPLGLMPTAEYTGGEAVLDVGDTLVLYTDGITEAANPEEEEYGRDRLAEICCGQRELSVDRLAEAIHHNVDEFVRGTPYHDDRTLVIMRRLG